MSGAKMHGFGSTKYYKILIAGESGLGKTTTMNSLLDMLRQDQDSEPGLDEDRQPQQHSALTPKTMTIKESEPIKLRSKNEKEQWSLRIVDTPGYGDHQDTGIDIQKIKAYIGEQYKKLYGEQIKKATTTANSHDSLVSVCLYFVAPHRIKPIDITFMKEVSEMV